MEFMIGEKTILKGPITIPILCKYNDVAQIKLIKFGPSWGFSL